MEPIEQNINTLYQKQDIPDAAPKEILGNKREKRIKIISRTVTVAIIILFIVSAILFYASHHTSLRYNDWWIVGNNISTVEARYGKYDIDTGRIAAYYLYNFDTNDYYYYMYYDSDGIITRVETGIQIGG